MGVKAAKNTGYSRNRPAVSVIKRKKYEVTKNAGSLAAKCAEKVSVHVFHRQGVTWAGKIALRICPDILAELASQVREDIFIVCGTNGKTTTNNMLCAFLWRRRERRWSATIPALIC